MLPTYDSIMVELSRVQKHIVLYEQVAATGLAFAPELSEF
jgi:hypothetical protein